MKIATLSANELELKEGGATGVAIGVAFIVAGAVGGVALRHSSPIAIWIGLAVATVGIAVMLFASSITVSANKATGQLRYQKKRLVGTQDMTYANRAGTWSATRLSAMGSRLFEGPGYWRPMCWRVGLYVTWNSC
jgi:hypothetical protein